VALEEGAAGQLKTSLGPSLSPRTLTFHHGFSSWLKPACKAMDIFNRPPAISEDRLQYALYPPPGQKDKTAVSSLAAVLQAHVDSLLPEFIWHRDTFQLKVARDLDAGDQDWMLEGTMRVGDCVDDEWCVVWLLKEITKRWDVVVRYVTYDYCVNLGLSFNRS
jgi:hypothetical protein